MHKVPIVALALVLPLMGSTARSQTAPSPIAPQQLPPASSKLNLTLEQRHTIREIVKDMKADTSSGGVQAVGQAVPPGVSPHPMPGIVGQKVPQVKAHRYFLTAEQIVIVDPKDDRVSEVIKRAED